MRSTSKFILRSSLAAFLVIALFALLSFDRYYTDEVREANANLETCMQTAWEFLLGKGGDFRIDGGKLLAGSYVVNGNFEVPDKVQKIFGGVATVFMGDTRVSTNVLREDGSRAVGTRLVGPAYDAIFKKGRAYRGETLVLGVPYLAAYDPIRDSTGKTVGVLFVGVKKSDFLAHIDSMKSQLTLLLFGLMVVFAALMLLLGRVLKRLDKAKEEHLQFLQTLIDTIPNPVFYKDAGGKYLGCNKAFATCIGTDRDKIVGRTVFDIAPPHLAEISHQADLELSRTKDVQVYESAVEFAGGSLRDVIFFKAAFPAVDGAPGGVIGTFLDISERKRAEAEIEAQKKFANSLVQNSTAPTFVLDRQHRVIIWNRACEELTGVKTADVLGTDEHWKAFYSTKRPLLADFIIDDNLTLMTAYYGSCMKSSLIPEGIQAERWFTDQDGKQHYILFAAAPLRDAQGQLVAAIQTIEDISEYRRETERTQQALSLLSATLESTADGILVRDLAENVIAHNEKFVEMWGLSPAVLTTKDDRRLRLSVLDQLKDPETFLDITENLYVHPEKETDDILELKDGRIFQRVSKPQIVNNQVVGRVVNFRDVTGQKKSEAELGRVNRALHTLSACNRALVYATEERSLLIEVCQSIARNGGYRFTWVGYAMDDDAKSIRPVAHAGHEDDGYLDTIQMTWGDAEQGRTPIGTAIRTGTPCLVRETTTDSCLTSWQEEAHRRGYLSSVALPLAADGVTFGALAIYAAEPAAFTVDEMELFQELAANLAYGIVALRTREERKKAEEALRQSAERYRSLVENVDLGITLIDGSYNVLMVNSAVGHMMAKPVGELLHKECFREFEKRTARCPYCPGATAMATGKPARVQTEGVRDDGSHFVAKITAFPVFDSNGKATQFIEVIQNITDQITVENEKKHLQEQLRQSQKFEAIGTLAGGIAHDFNNFLTVITAYCTLIGRKTTEDDPLRNYLNKMLTATEKAALLTQSLLAYSRKQAIDLRPVDIKEIIHKSHNLLARLLREDIELTVRTADEDLTIMADSLQIEQVLMNLATNARDAMPGGGILRITAELLEMGDEFVKSHGYGTPGRYALLAVADSGNGMDETTRERIFEPFFTTKEVGKGTGLGLSMAFGIIKQHNGYIDVYSEPGKGTTFRIFLPLTDSVQAERKQAESIRHEGGNETILLVEDDSAIRASLKELLEEVGYTIIEAMDGEDGILKFTEYEREIQLLLLDVIMPKKNGKEVYEEIRALRPDIKAVFVSGYTADILTAKGVLQDDLTLISKPVTIEALSVKIREMLDT